MYESIYILYVYDIYHDSTWKRLRQPCANLAPSLCFAGFPCVTPHNENVKSYKSVGCVPPRLKFLFRTFDRLPYIYIWGFPQQTHWFSLLKMINHWGVKWGYHHLRKHPIYVYIIFQQVSKVIHIGEMDLSPMNLSHHSSPAGNQMNLFHQGLE